MTIAVDMGCKATKTNKQISISVYQTFMLMMGLCTYMINTLKPLKQSYKETLIIQNIGAKKTDFHTSITKRHVWLEVLKRINDNRKLNLQAD